MSAPIILGGKGTKIARVDEMEKSVKAHLVAIANWFDDPKVTLIVRNAGGDFIVTNDTTAEAAAALLAHGNKPN